METTTMNGRPKDGPRGRAALVALALAAACWAAPAAAQDGGDVDSARAALEQWVQARRVLGQERRDWELGRQVLDERIALVQREIDGLRASIGAAQGSIAEADRKRDELLASNARLKASAEGLLATVATLEARAVALLPRLPEPIRERVRPLSQRLPAPGAAVEPSLGERFQNVVGVLNEVDKFQREITLTSEVRTLADGSSAEVTAVYVGVGRGFYASANGKAAGVGVSTPDGWAWAPADDAAPAIAQAIAILKNEKPAAFVRLPVQIDEGTP
jgi:hypothetical protein